MNDNEIPQSRALRDLFLRFSLRKRTGYTFDANVW